MEIPIAPFVLFFGVFLVVSLIVIAKIRSDARNASTQALPREDRRTPRTVRAAHSSTGRVRLRLRTQRAALAGHLSGARLHRAAPDTHAAPAVQVSRPLVRELSIGEIAGKLGYSELPNFTRAFRKWTGMTPAGYRARR